LERAYEAFQKRTTMPGWAEETFMAQLEMGRIAVLLGRPEHVVLGDLLAAYDLRPTRAEPLYELGQYFRKQKMYGKAYLFAKAGVLTPQPKDRLFVAQDVYDWRLLDEVAVAAFWIGNYHDSKVASEEALSRIDQGLDVPADDIRRIRENLRHAINKLAR
jgi:hypothetical protein